MNYIFPSATINYVIYTAKRIGQFPTIQYVSGGTAGKEVVTLNNTSLSTPKITIKIEEGVSTNEQIIQAILEAKDLSVKSLYVNDLISVEVILGHKRDKNIKTNITYLSNGSLILPPEDKIMHNDGILVDELEAVPTKSFIYTPSSLELTANASAQSEEYVQEDVQSVTDLTNSLKTNFNKLVSAYNNEVLSTLLEVRLNYNAMVSLTNELKEKYNDAVLLINELKTRLDAIITKK